MIYGLLVREKVVFRLIWYEFVGVKELNMTKEEASEEELRSREDYGIPGTELYPIYR